MTAAFAPAFLPLEFEDEFSAKSGSAQSLLAPQGGKSSHVTQAAGVALYALILVAVVTYTTRPRDQVDDEPIPLVMLPAPEAPVEAPPKIDEPPPPPPVVEQVQPAPMPAEPIVEPVPQPPPPIAAEPVAPVEPKPVPLPEQKKPVEHKPILLPRHVETPPRPAAPAPPPPNAIASGYANQVHAKIARVAINSYPRAAQLRNETGRVSYHIVIGPSGELLSKSIVPSGNSTFDTAAAEALSRSAPFPATGMAKPVSLSGAITYRMN
jgi:periplasmic protein TonB